MNLLSQKTRLVSFRTHAHWLGISFRFMSGTTTVIPPLGFSVQLKGDPLYPTRVTTVFADAEGAPSTRLFSLGHDSKVAYTTAGFVLLFWVYLGKKQNAKLIKLDVYFNSSVSESPMTALPHTQPQRWSIHSDNFMKYVSRAFLLTIMLDNYCSPNFDHNLEATFWNVKAQGSLITLGLLEMEVRESIC